MFERDTYNYGFRMAVVVLALLGSNAMAGSFDLRIDDVSGLDAPWPLVGGLPFPEGELRDGSQIRVVGADGAEVPAQVDVTATWRDGSIRWALVGFHSNPQEEYRIEFGSGIVRHAPAQPLRIERDASGGLTVDTGAAVYEFLPDRLLPENARMQETIFLAGSGDGAYLVDQQGRTARVAGAAAELASEIVNQGPARAVVRREGWYVTEDGQRVARAAGPAYPRQRAAELPPRRENGPGIRAFSRRGRDRRVLVPPKFVVVRSGLNRRRREHIPRTLNGRRFGTLARSATPERTDEAVAPVRPRPATGTARRPDCTTGFRHRPPYSYTYSYTQISVA